ncbi:MAG: glycosyltransferase family 2 protein [Bacteroidota bacterium]
MDLSIIIPVFNEEKNLKVLHRSISEVVGKLKLKYELIFVDDGSTDGGLELLRSIKKSDAHVIIISFRKNFGQTSAWDAGIKQSRGKYLVTIDSDLQNDPSDIPRLIDKIKGGFDVVSGWRYERKDKIFKRCFSFFANCVRRVLLKEKIHDSGCSLKIYKKECFEGIDLGGEMHRYITGILSIKGFKVGELKVKHHPRRYGVTKYGVSRLSKGLLDLMMVAFLTRYSSRPIHIFGGLGIMTFLFGFAVGLYLAFTKIMYNASLSNRPLLILSVLLVILGVQFIIFGVIAEVLMKIYNKTHNIQNYCVKEIL